MYITPHRLLTAHLLSAYSTALLPVPALWSAARRSTPAHRGSTAAPAGGSNRGAMRQGPGRSGPARLQTAAGSGAAVRRASVPSCLRARRGRAAAPLPARATRPSGGGCLTRPRCGPTRTRCADLALLPAAAIGACVLRACGGAAERVLGGAV